MSDTEIKHVNPGDDITAEGYNALVDAVQQRTNIPGKSYVNTPEGAVFVPSINSLNQANERTSLFGQCYIGPALRRAYSSGSSSIYDNFIFEDAEISAKHIYMQLGEGDSLLPTDWDTLDTVLPSLRLNGWPTLFIGWSYNGVNHIINHRDLYTHNLAASYSNGIFDGDKIHTHTSIVELPFTPKPKAKLYGAFYKLWISSTAKTGYVGHIFILSYVDEVEDNLDAIPWHSFSSGTTFSSELGSFTVLEQASIPQLFLEFQDESYIPGTDNKDSFPLLIPSHTGDIINDVFQEKSFGMFSMKSFAYGTTDGKVSQTYNNIPIMLLSICDSTDEDVLPWTSHILSDNRIALFHDNITFGGKPVAIEIDSSTVVITDRVITEGDVNSATKPFVWSFNAPDSTTEFGAISRQAWLVMPKDFLLECDNQMHLFESMHIDGIISYDTADILPVLQFLLDSSYIYPEVRPYNRFTFAQITTPSFYTCQQFISKNTITQGINGNYLKDIPIVDSSQYFNDLDDVPYGANRSVEWANVLSSIDRDGNPVEFPNIRLDDQGKRQMALQLRNFNDQSNFYSASFLSSQGVLSSTDVVVRICGKRPGLADSKGAFISYVSLSSILGDNISAEISVDTDCYSSPYQHSVEKIDNIVQLYNFDQMSSYTQTFTPDFDDTNILSNRTIDFLARNSTTAGKELEYKKLTIPHEQTDNDYFPLNGSLNWETSVSPKLLQLRDFTTTNNVNAYTPQTLGNTTGDAIIVRKAGGAIPTLEYMSPSSLSSFVPTAPNLSALNNLSVVTGIEYPMSGTNQYKIVAHRKEMSIVNNTLVLTDLPDQTIDTIPYSEIV